MRTSELCILALLAWTAVVNAQYASLGDTSRQQKTLQANSVSSRDREDVTSRAASSAPAIAIQQLMVLRQLEEDRLAQEVLSQQEQRNQSYSQGALSQQQRNESGSQEALNLQQQRNESGSQEALNLQQQRNESASQEVLNLQQQGNESWVQVNLSTRLQETETALREAVHEMKQQLQERDDAIRSLLNEKMQRVDEKMTDMGERVSSCSAKQDIGRTASQDRNEAIHDLRLSLNGRMQRVEKKLADLVHQQASFTKKGECGCTKEQLVIDQHEKKLMNLEGRVQEVLTEQRERFNVRYLIEQAQISKDIANISQKEEDLCKAAFEGRLEDVRRLLDAGADVFYTSHDCYSPLISAFFIPFRYAKANPDVVSLLLDRGADVTAIGGHGLSPLLFAISAEASIRCVTWLIAAGADVNAVTGFLGNYSSALCCP